MAKIKINKITFNRTGSLSNAACFKHDNNVCACIQSTSVVNLSLEMDSATSISYTTGKVSPFDAAFRLTMAILLRMRSFDHTTTFGLKSDVIYIWIQRTCFPIKTPSFARNTIFGDFCDDNVCAWAVSTLIKLMVVNISPRMDSTTSVSCMT